jgi:hypothetical protein
MTKATAQARQGASTQLLVNFSTGDAKHAASRPTVKRLAALLGFNETQTVLYAIARLRDDLLPAYPTDDGPVSARYLSAIKRRVHQRNYTPSRSLFDGA